MVAAAFGFGSVSGGVTNVAVSTFLGCLSGGPDG